MANSQERTAQEVVGKLIDMQIAAKRLRAHSTVRSNKALAADVEAIERDGKDAATLACILWFRSDHLEDVAGPNLPDAA